MVSSYFCCFKTLMLQFCRAAGGGRQPALAISHLPPLSYVAMGEKNILFLSYRSLVIYIFWSLLFSCYASNQQPDTVINGKKYCRTTRKWNMLPLSQSSVETEAPEFPANANILLQGCQCWHILSLRRCWTIADSRHTYSTLATGSVTVSPSIMLKLTDSSPHY